MSLYFITIIIVVVVEMNIYIFSAALEALEHVANNHEAKKSVAL